MKAKEEEALLLQKKITEGFIKYLKTGKPFYLGNVYAKRDWGYAKEYVRVMHKMLQQEIPDDYVIGTGESHSVEEFANFVFDYAGLKLSNHLIINPRLYRPHEVPALCGDYSKAKVKLGWEPKVKFKELAKIMYEADLKLLIKS